MDAKQFLDVVAVLPGEYRLTVDKAGQVYCDGLQDTEGLKACLIVAVCFYSTGRLFSIRDFHKAGELIGMLWHLRQLTVSCLDYGKTTPDGDLPSTDADGRQEEPAELDGSRQREDGGVVPDWGTVGRQSPISKFI